jgi:hypothetical protein
MVHHVNAQKARISAKVEEVKRDFSDGITELLKETNKWRLGGKGKIVAAPKVDHNSLRWTLAWKEGKIAFELNVVVSIEDDGRRARVGRVWVHRHASTPFDFDGHTPTTRMRRLTGLAIEEIREAIETEWG